jgi:hypothetical protein
MATIPYYDIVIPDQILRDARMYFGDFPEENRLIRGTELSDDKIRFALQIFIHHFNNIPPVLITKFGAKDFPSALVLFQGATVEMLRMAGFIQSRNFLNFNDGGVSFTVSDKAVDYQQWIGNLLGNLNQSILNIKVGQNAEEGFDYIDSPEAWYFILSDGG